MNILQQALNSPKRDKDLPGEQIFLAIEEFLEKVQASSGESLKDEYYCHLSLEDGTTSHYKHKKASLALESLTGTMIGVIVAIGVAVLALMYKLYKHFFGTDSGKSMHDKVDDLSTALDDGSKEIGDHLNTITDSKNTIQDETAKKEMQAKIDALNAAFEEKVNNNLKFKVIADNKATKRFVNYYTNLNQIVEKLSVNLKQLEAQVDKGVDIMKMVSSSSDANNQHLSAILAKETQTLDDKLDIYMVMAETHKLDETVNALTEYRLELEKKPMPSNFVDAMSKNEAKAFITSILRQESLTMSNLSKQIESSKDNIDAIIEVTKKYDGIGDKYVDISISSPELTKYFAALRKGMVCVKYHTKAVLLLCKTQNLLYQATYDCSVALVQHTVDMAGIVEVFSPPENKSLLKTAKQKLGNLFNNITGKSS